jgi:hypothetical protein
MEDDFDVEVRNKNLDRTCLVDELSDGQFVLVNEAVNLGIAIYNAGIAFPDFSQLLRPRARGRAMGDLGSWHPLLLPDRH